MRLFLVSLVAAACIAAVLVVLPGPASITSASPARGDSGTRWWSRLSRLRPGRPEQMRKDAAELLRQFSALLQSGRGEGQAWTDLREQWRRRDPDHPLGQVCATVAASESAGAGAAQGLRRCLEHSPHLDPQLARTLRRLLAVTALSEQTGAPLSQLVEQLADSMDDSAELSAAVHTAVAGPKLTQLILTLLPVGGVGLGQIMGADPLASLLGGGFGLACLVGGLCFLLLGRWWSERMIQTVMRHV